ncbi:MAG: T9SS type A sorting domain-containing protein [Bacteroidetes bacterium]|nr:T9SS type A sorting domain-containing protein [Bacteroidota bacterium]
MKLTFLLFFALFFNLHFTYSQKDVALSIVHQLKGEPFAFNQASSNNLGEPFILDRLEYYLSKFTIVHDGGQTTVVNDTVVALVRANENTLIPLGTFTYTSIESIKFHVGVFDPVNHEDPSLYSVSHPLGPKSPSMHWGWTSGYRFVALEGYGNSQFNQVIQLHGLGDENYFETTVATVTTDVFGTDHLTIYADYERGLRGMSLDGGLISHGSDGAAAQLLVNFRDHVFTSNATANIQKKNIAEFRVFPIPSTGNVRIDWSQNNSFESLEIYNVQGSKIFSKDVSKDSQTSIFLENSGVYFVRLTDKSGNRTESKLIIE